MKIDFLNAAAVRKALLRFISDYDEFHWAVAWGSWAEHGQALLRHKAKFRNVIFGVAFSQTDPALVDALVGVNHARVATRFPGGTFHPKVYCFRSGRRAAAIVGSANFTNGGLGNNHEAAVVIEGDVHDSLFTTLLNFVSASARDYGTRVTADYAEAYRIQHRRARRLEKPKRDPVPPTDQLGIRRVTSRVATMSWQDYLRQVRASPHHPIKESLALLKIARGWFEATPSFADLDTPRQKAIAGIIGDYQRLTPDLERNWGWFGSMKGAGYFAHLIDGNNEHMALAVDSIPLRGEVTEEHYKTFVGHFLRAFRGLQRTGKVPTASRLLAMKRPDIFLCVCKPNRAGVSRAMGFSPSTLDLDNYWERVVETVRLSDWYYAPRPAPKQDGEVWDNRVAMLDAIYYAP